MYSPPFYKESRPDLIQKLIEKYGFATLITENKTNLISHLPFILTTPPEGTAPELISHMAKANPHWKELKESPQTKIIFQGPHGYITPAWYTPKEDNVPTWNYAVVHVTGTFEIIENEAAAYQAMNRLVTKFENQYQTGWKLEKNPAIMTDIQKGIVVFKIKDLKFEGKFKLAQKLESGDRNNVIKELKALPGESAPAGLAEYMEQVLANKS